MWRRVYSELLAAAVPPACVACRQPVAAGELLCAPCRRALPWLRGTRCARCALPSPCRPCPAGAAAFDAAWAPLAYAGPARAVVTALKFGGALALADLMAAQIAARLPPALAADATLVPVPLHPLRARRRGFDQAARLAAALARRTGLPVAACLQRGGEASRQAGAARRERLAARRLAVSTRGPAPRIALLVDDVHTTGATFDACAVALRAAGSGRVGCVAYARAL